MRLARQHLTVDAPARATSGTRDHGVICEAITPWAAAAPVAGEGTDPPARAGRGACHRNRDRNGRLEHQTRWRPSDLAATACWVPQTPAPCPTDASVYVACSRLHPFPYHARNGGGSPPGFRIAGGARSGHPDHRRHRPPVGSFVAPADRPMDKVSSGGRLCGGRYQKEPSTTWSEVQRGGTTGGRVVGRESSVGAWSAGHC